MLGALLILVAVTSTPAYAARSLPTWAGYRADRAVAMAWRALAEQRPEAAVTAADRATELEPARQEAWHVLTRARIAIADWEGAHDAVLALRRLAPDAVGALELQGRIAVELGSRREAHEAFSALDGLQPGLAGPRVGLALVAARLDGDIDAAVAHLLVAQARDPSLDLSVLLLRPHWRALADDDALVDALTGLLQEP